MAQRAASSPGNATAPKLADRLVAFGGLVCGAMRRAPRELMLDHVFRQLARAATSPAANYAEAREAVSTRDYVHKLKICVKELRESLAWLEMLQAAGFRATDIAPLIDECNQLIAICVTCIRKAQGQR